MKNIKKCPLLALILASGLLFTIIAISGRRGAYAGQDLDLLRAPFLSVMFTAMKEEIYPWEIVNSESEVSVETFMAQKEAKTADTAGKQEQAKGSEEGEVVSLSELLGTAGKAEGGKIPGMSDSAEMMEAQSGEAEPGEESPGASGAASGHGVGVTEASGQAAQFGEGSTGASGQATGSGEESPGALGQAAQFGEGSTTASGAEQPGKLPLERLEPLRETTYDEYINHISADIYGDAGVIRASEYEFETVDESYFDDALFIGDSRMVGMHDYTDLSEHADFYCETALTIHKVLEQDFKGKGTVEEALKAKDYGKIYIMVGINELGTGTTEDFMKKYTEVVDTLCELEPEAKIFIQGIMKVAEKKNNSDPIFNNTNISARNNAIATLADNERIFYVDVNEVVCDEAGNLNEDYTHDEIHLLGMYNDLCKQFLMEHGA